MEGDWMFSCISMDGIRNIKSSESYSVWLRAFWVVNILVFILKCINKTNIIILSSKWKLMKPDTRYPNNITILPWAPNDLHRTTALHSKIFDTCNIDNSSGLCCCCMLFFYKLRLLNYLIYTCIQIFVIFRMMTKKCLPLWM